MKKIFANVILYYMVSIIFFSHIGSSVSFAFQSDFVKTCASVCPVNQIGKIENAQCVETLPSLMSTTLPLPTVGIFDFFIGIISWVLQAIWGVVEGIFSAIIWIVKIITMPIRWILRIIFAPIVWVAKTIWKGITWVAKTIWKGITWVAKTIWKGITWFAKKIFMLISVLVIPVVRWGCRLLTSAYPYVRQFVEKMYFYIKQFVKAGEKSLTPIIKKFKPLDFLYRIHDNDLKLNKEAPFLLKVMGGHRSWLTHSCILILLFAVAARRIKRVIFDFVFILVTVLSSLHLFFDIFPVGWKGTAMIHFPGNLSGGRFISIIWLLINIIVGVIVAFRTIGYRWGKKDDETCSQKIEQNTGIDGGLGSEM